MSMGLLAAASTTSLRWHALPPLWVVVLVIVPAVLLGVRFMYRREAGDVGTRLRMAMGLLRSLAILLALGALFGPYAETIEGEYFKRHLILCVDTSRSMRFKDGYASDPALAVRLREAAGLPPGAELSNRSRLDLVRSLIGSDRGYLERLAEKVRLHLFTFDGSIAGCFEQREGETPSEAAARLLERLARLEADGSVTRIGTAIHDLVRTFDAKNEPVAGIVMFTDGAPPVWRPSVNITMPATGSFFASKVRTRSWMAVPMRVTEPSASSCASRPRSRPAASPGVSPSRCSKRPAMPLSKVNRCRRNFSARRSR